MHVSVPFADEMSFVAEILELVRQETKRRVEPRRLHWMDNAVLETRVNLVPSRHEL
jgi:hypothetical protein